MRSPDENASHNLSGVWRGAFSYPRKHSPTFFIATLIETESWLTGSTEEIAAHGDERGGKIAATLQGRRTGMSVTWLKLYDRASRTYDSVHYAGEISGDGNEIHGRWTVPGSWSGPFLMIRAGKVGEALTREMAERV